MDEMKRRGYHPDEIWYQVFYRGKELGIQENWIDKNKFIELYKNNDFIFLEHNDKYLQECLDNLKNKGIEINIK